MDTLFNPHNIPVPVLESLRDLAEFSHEYPTRPTKGTDINVEIPWQWILGDRETRGPLITAIVFPDIFWSVALERVRRGASFHVPAIGPKNGLPNIKQVAVGMMLKKAPRTPSSFLLNESGVASVQVSLLDHLLAVTVQFCPNLTRLVRSGIPEQLHPEILDSKALCLPVSHHYHCHYFRFCDQAQFAAFHVDGDPGDPQVFRVRERQALTSTIRSLQAGKVTWRPVQGDWINPAGQRLLADHPISDGPALGCVGRTESATTCPDGHTLLPLPKPLYSF